MIFRVESQARQQKLLQAIAKWLRGRGIRATPADLRRKIVYEGLGMQWPATLTYEEHYAGYGTDVIIRVASDRTAADATADMTAGRAGHDE